jgi:hypothetical protein
MRRMVVLVFFFYLKINKILVLSGTVVTTILGIEVLILAFLAVFNLGRINYRRATKKKSRNNQVSINLEDALKAALKKCFLRSSIGSISIINILHTKTFVYALN